MKKTWTIMLFLLLLFPAAAAADECTEGDCINGKSTMIFDTGHKYTGGFKDGQRHGAGILLMPGGRKIVGVWGDNEIKTGTYTGSDGTVYEGQWKFRERNGQGTMIFPDGKKQEGLFKNGEFAGG